jgi:hypothetical protein
MKLIIIEGDNAGGFLSAVLEGVQSQGGMGGCIIVAKDAENAAFFMKFVVI